MIIEKIIYDLEDSLLNPKFRKSRDLLDTMISDEFLEFGSSGCITNKEETINALLIEETREITITNFKVKQLSNEVVLSTYISLENGKSTLRSSIWKKYNGNWRILFHQGTKSSQ